MFHGRTTCARPFDPKIDRSGAFYCNEKAMEPITLPIIVCNMRMNIYFMTFFESVPY